MTCVRDFGAAGDGEHDDTDAIRAAIAAADNVMDRRVFFPPGSYRVPPKNDAIFTIPSGFKVHAADFSTILFEAGADDWDYLFACDAARDVQFENLHVVGSNTPFEEVAQFQSSAINLWGNCKDITVRDCSFESLWGFSVHGYGGGFQGTSDRINVVGCFFQDTANGLNVCCDYSTQSGNTLINTEGIEFVGTGCQVQNNLILGTRGTGISAGGAGGLNPLSVVSGNVIDGATVGGIMCGDSFVQSQVINNTLLRCKLGGILQHEIGIESGWSIAAYNLFDGNIIVGCGDSGASYGMRISGTGGNTITNNRISPGVPRAGFMNSALIVSSPDNYVAGNVLQAAPGQIDLVLDTHAARTTLGLNQLVNGSTALQGAASIQPVDRVGLELDEVVETSRIVGQFHARFRRRLDGHLSWGSNDTGLDTNLYRAGPALLRTDGELSAASVVVGGKRLVFNADGSVSWIQT